MTRQQKQLSALKRQAEKYKKELSYIADAPRKTIKVNDGLLAVQYVIEEKVRQREVILLERFIKTLENLHEEWTEWDKEEETK